ncbi:MAG: hypothetical protein AB7G08_23900 [Hyphomicrobiaceae bacterium]
MEKHTAPRARLRRQKVMRMDPVYDIEEPQRYDYPRGDEGYNAWSAALLKYWDNRRQVGEREVDTGMVVGVDGSVRANNLAIDSDTHWLATQIEEEMKKAEATTDVPHLNVDRKRRERANKKAA